MMRRTASLQVNLDSGTASAGITGYRQRWELAHRIGPVLVAAFANSPLSGGRPTGWVSTRQATWAAMDPGRTRPPGHDPDPRAAWARYALDAQVLCIRGTADTDTDAGDAADWTAPPGLTFRDWVRGAAAELRRPTAADLDYHLSTLFPPVRPRGWLELRMTDAQVGDAWVVPTALAAALLDDPVAADAALAATETLCPDGQPVPPDDVWRRAARIGPADPDLGKAVRACFTAAESALARSDSPAALRAAVAAFAERYAERGRCPAHDQLDALSRV
jgi:ergothioneine biosynthesis glutamate--cysteine ligase EgtA